MQQFDYKEFAVRLKQIRWENGLSQVKMSENAELTRHTINSWENSKNVPSVQNLFQFCVTYGVSMDWLCGIGESKELHGFEKGGGRYSENESL